MAELHRTTMTPTKLELLAQWLPLQPWYDGRDAGPQLTRVGGFRLDDPDGEVGIEVLLVGDDAGGTRRTYCVPMTYRGAPLDGAEHALVGTSEHGVLGPRWLYDGPHDPVFVAQLVALLAGEAQPQHQTESRTPDLTVELVGPALPHLDATSFEVLPTPPYTSLAVRGADATTTEVVRVLRVVTPAATTGGVTAVRVRWQTAAGATESGPVVVGAQTES